MKRILFYVLCVFLTFLISCTKKTQEPRKTHKINIGIAGPLTGDLAIYGTPAVRATKLAIKQYNSNTSNDRFEVNLIVEDDSCNHAKSSAIAENFINKNVKFVIGHICSGASKAALDKYKESNYKLIMISPSATNPILTTSGNYQSFFRTTPTDNNQAEILVDFAINQKKLNKIAVVHDGGDFGRGIALYIKELIENKNKESIALFKKLKRNKKGYISIVKDLSISGADSIVFCGYYKHASKIIEQMKLHDLDIAFLSTDSITEDDFITLSGIQAEGVYGVDIQDVTKNSFSHVALDDYKKEYNDIPGKYFYNTYSAVITLLSAIAKVDNHDIEKIKYRLQNDFIETPIGKIKFDTKGDLQGSGFSIYQVQNGKYVEVFN